MAAQQKSYAHYWGRKKNVWITTILAAINYRDLQYLLLCPGWQGVFQLKMWLNLGKSAKVDLRWWTHSLDSTSHSTAHLTSLELWTDTLSLVGWGGHCSWGPAGSGTVGGAAAPLAHKPQGTRGSRAVAEGANEGGGCGQAKNRLASRGGLCEQTGRHTLQILCAAALNLWKDVLNK